MDTSLKNFKISDLKNPKFVKPFKIEFQKNNKNRSWECVKVYDSVSILVFHQEFDSFLLVKQFRPSLWYHQSSLNINTKDLGYSYELCSGIMDKNLSPKLTAIQEIEEELGYKVNDLKYITKLYGALGFAASSQHLFFVNIDETMKINNGGGLDGEDIELFWLKKSQALEFICDESYPKTATLNFFIMWYLSQKSI